MAFPIGPSLSSHFISVNGLDDQGVNGLEGTGERSNISGPMPGGFDTSSCGFERSSNDYSGISNNRWASPGRSNSEGQQQLPWAQPMRGQGPGAQPTMADIPESFFTPVQNSYPGTTQPTSDPSSISTGTTTSSPYTDPTSTSTSASTSPSTATSSPVTSGFVPLSDLPDWVSNPGVVTPVSTAPTTATSPTSTSPSTSTSTSTDTSTSSVTLTAASAQAMGYTNSSNADAQAALENIQPFLNGTSTSATGAISGSAVLEDGADINDVSDTTAGSARATQAASLVTANAPAVAEVLPTADVPAYNQIMSSLSSDPVAQVSLQKLALTGDLFNTTTDPATGATLDTIGQLANIANGTTALDPSLDRGSYLGQLVKETATPSASNQEQTQDCALDACTTMADRLSSAEFVRVASQAASPTGTVTWANGTADTRAGSAADDGSGVPLPLQVLNNVQEVAAGTDPTTGTTPQGIVTLTEKMFNTPATLSQVDLTSDSTIASSQASMMATLTASTANNSPVLAGVLDVNGAGHELLVNGVINVNGNSMVEYTDSWGQEEMASAASFQANLCTIITTGAQTAQQASSAQMYAGVTISA